ncbi:hypothetical protein [Nostoc sp. CMAA1605]|uniref:hypothetical protein n=1 Tax=Nostoc sp. CMAA1605 TaxID=2055159 RepID=UPI001F4860A9|nr:hypothetical protein [Nostoc sp. CMAA1605]MCF4969314.1 hypothetical protein [Nostoc sp. CMAA1605]
MKKIIIQGLIFSILILSSVSCGNNQANNSPPSQVNTLPPNINETVAATPVNNVIDKTEKIKFKTEGGADLFAIKQRPDGAKLVDGKDEELARIKTDDSGKIKVKNAQDKVLGYVINADGSWTIQDAEKKDKYFLKRNSDNTYQLEDNTKKQLYQITTNKAGLEITTPDKKLVYQVRIKEGKISLRNASGGTVFSTKSNMSPIAFACFGLDSLTREQQAALAYAVNLTGG